MRVVVEGLAHRFPGTDLLFEHLDFVAEPGSTIAVCGPSGCGKSTLLSILAGWEKPYAGTVTREGVNRVGWVFQNPYGVAERTALDHVVFPLLAKGMRRKEAEPKALEAMGLFDLEYAADRRFSDLSGGEAQRLMLARAVCSKPDMLLVDEPTAQLDTAHRAFRQPCAEQPFRPRHDRARGHTRSRHPRRLRPCARPRRLRARRQQIAGTGIGRIDE